MYGRQFLGVVKRSLFGRNRVRATPEGEWNFIMW